MHFREILNKDSIGYENENAESEMGGVKWL